MKITAKLLIGFGLICATVAALGIAMVWSLMTFGAKVDQVTAQRMPVAFAGAEIKAELNGALAALRGFMLTNQPAQKELRAEAWSNIARAREKIDSLIAATADPADQAKWDETKKILAELSAVQTKVEGIVGTPEALPATALLLKEGAPRVEAMLMALTGMIDAEQGQEASAERKAVLIAMANSRGRLTAAIADLRGFLATGDEKFKAGFAEKWKGAQAAMTDLAGKAALLTPDQATQFAELKKIEGEFQPISEQIVEIRSGDKWNLPLATLKVEALPRVAKLADLLDGEKQQDGSRQGGIVSNQKALMQGDSDEMERLRSWMTALAWVLLIGGVVAGIGIAVMTARSIVKPLSQLNGIMRKLAANDLAVEVAGQTRKDEIGDMAKTVQVFKNSMLETERLNAAQKREEAAKAERQRKIEAYIASFDKAASAATKMLASAATELQATAQSMSATAEETNRQASAVSAASTQASANVATVATAAEELSASVQEISRQVAESTRISSQAVEDATRTNETVRGLAEASRKIGDVVSLISDIAGQTNLLALNATIEAARAGEAGKGFAVVASEVKNLANQTAKATEEITAQIGEIQKATNDSVAAIGSIGATIKQVNEIASAIAAAVEEQNAATLEIARNVQEAAKGTNEVSANIGGVTQAASDTGAASGQVLSAASDLSKQSETLRGEIDRFLGDIRSA